MSAPPKATAKKRKRIAELEEEKKSSNESSTDQNDSIKKEAPIASSMLPRTPEKRRSLREIQAKAPKSRNPLSLLSPQSEKNTPAKNRIQLGGIVATRRSSRVKELAGKQTLAQVHDMIRNQLEPGLREVAMPEKYGFGVLTSKKFKKGEYVCEYSGDLVTMKQAKERELSYIKEDNKKGLAVSMCYMYYLEHGGRKLCVDATKSGRIGRLINHSRKNPNLQTKLFVVDDVPHLGLVAIRDIDIGEEVSYDYGEKDPTVIQAHPWLANS
eukprot:m.333896 g.333896  ORF g.333896 m.333896 type:complete len:269 (-) comp17241_c0_seq1:1033-1839(-)